MLIGNLAMGFQLSLSATVKLVGTLIVSLCHVFQFSLFVTVLFSAFLGVGDSVVPTFYGRPLLAGEVICFNSLCIVTQETA